MTALLTHLAAVERLGLQADTLSPEFLKSLGSNLEYARFGAALPELPYFSTLRRSVGMLMLDVDEPRFTGFFLRKAPVAFGFRAAALVGNGALVGYEAGLAFLAGYFTQLCVRRSLAPTIQRLQRKLDKDTSRARIEWSISLHLMQDLYGTPLVGKRELYDRLHLNKGRLAQGLGRGLYELTRVAALDSFGEAPTKACIDSAMRGFSLYAIALSSPLGVLRGITTAHPEAYVYRNSDLDILADIDRGLARTREVLSLISRFIKRGSFSGRPRARLAELLPEGSEGEPVAL